MVVTSKKKDFVFYQIIKVYKGRNFIYVLFGLEHWTDFSQRWVARPQKVESRLRWGDKEMQIPFQEEMQIPIKANPIRSTFLVDRYQSWSTCPLLQNLQNISAIWF